MSEARAKAQPQGRWKKDWRPYPVSRTVPNRFDAEGDRDMSLLDSLAVRDAIERQANLAHLSEPERSTLSAILHETWRYGRLTVSASHSYLAVYANRGPRKMGEPLVGLREKGFIDYSPGAPSKSPEGHRQTHSVIRPLIPAGWERFRDGGWREAEEQAGTEGGSRSPRASEGLGFREGKVSDSEPGASRIPRGQGLGFREGKVSDSGAQSGRLTRGGYDGEDKTGETRTPPSALRASPPSNGGLLSPAVIGDTWGADDVVRLLRSTSNAEGQALLTPVRADELAAGITELRQSDPTITDAETVYLVGLWAGDRRLRNADHFADNARRHRAEARSLADLLIAEPARTWLAWGYEQGQEHRRKRLKAHRHRTRAEQHH